MPPEAAVEAREALQHSAERTAFLLEVATNIAAMESLDELLTYIVNVTAKETGAERGTLFLNDERTGELYSRIATGLNSADGFREIRILNTSGVAGDVFTKGQGTIVADAYRDIRFNQDVDSETGFTTRNIMCAPIATPKGEVIGVLQMLNKTANGAPADFNDEDYTLLEAMTRQTAMALRAAQRTERMIEARRQELRFLDLVSEITADMDLSAMLAKVVNEAARMLDADRATLFLHDEKKGELFSRVAMGDSVGEIRLPSSAGIAGAVFTSGQPVNIPYAYADLRFNPAFDKRTGYFTRSILCIPIVNAEGKTIGVIQVLNKRGGPFTSEDQTRLRAFTAQLAINLENAKLFDDIQNMKNYNEGVLQSMSSGVITLNADGRIVTCNSAGLRILQTKAEDVINHLATDVFTDANSWLLERVKTVAETHASDVLMDAELLVRDEKLSVNLTVLPLMGENESSGARGPKYLGNMLMIEDVSQEKRMKSTMSRYMDPAIAEKLMSGGGDALGGRSVTATILFSDIASFTTISEDLGPHGTVSMLNEYFTIMVECINKQGGMLDKFIGDAIMAAFGLPLPHEDDEDRAVRAAIDMVRELAEWNRKRIDDGKRVVESRIGLNTDNVVSGNIGSPRRMDYTVIGDGVNLASRLESACKEYGARIMISENTYRKLRGVYRIREVDRIIVKGKTEPVGVYEILDYHTEESFPNVLDALEYYRGGLAAYRQQDWDRAESAFARAASLNPKDKLLAMYRERVQHMRENPPAPDWDGVWVMKTK